jgi:ADP-ribose diphosphatase
MKPFKVLSEQVVFKTNNRISVIESKLETPEGKPVTWNYLSSRDGVIVLPLDNQNNVYLKKEWRLNRKDFVWEVVSGWIEEENPTSDLVLAAANRELQEEIGFKSRNLELLDTFYLSNQMSTKFHIFLARGLVESKLLGDDDEFLEVEKYPFAEAYQIVAQKQIPTAQNLLVFLLVKEKLKL